MRRCALPLLWMLACSAPLEGERASEPVTDWSFVADADDVVFATPDGARFRSVQTSPLVHDGNLYLHVSTILSLNDPALDALLEGRGLQMLTGGRLYEFRTRRLETAREIDPLLPDLVRDDLKVEATGIRWDPEPERYPGTQVHQWFFALEPRVPGNPRE